MSGRGTHPKLAVAAGAIAACVVLLVTARAYADENLGTVEGQTYMRDSVSDVPAGTGVAIVAACPGGTHVIGGGAYQSGPSSQSLINSFFPTDGTDSGTAPDDGFAARFYSRTDDAVIRVAYAICAGGTQPTYVTRDGSVTGDGTLGARAAGCPPGTHVSDGGVRVFAGAAAAELKSSNPVDGGDADTTTDDGWRARIVSNSGGTVDFRAVAICRSIMPLYASESMTFPPNTLAGHTTACPTASPPAPVMGGGFNIQGDPLHIHATTSGPRASPGFLGESWLFYGDSAPSASPGTISHYAICKP